MVEYSRTNENIDKILVDETCKTIYNDGSGILDDPVLDLQQKNQALLSLIDKHNDHFLVHYILAEFYFLIDQYDTSIKYYNACIERNDKFMDAYMNMAIIFHKFGHTDKTKLIIESGLQKEPTNIQLMNFMGALYYLDDDYFRACTYYEDIIKTPREPTITVKNIYSNLGFSYSAIGECQLALDCFNIGLSLQCIKCREKNDIIKADKQLLENKLMNYDYIYNLPENTGDVYLQINTILNSVPNYTYTTPRDGRLHIGYISADLRQHVVSRFINCILKKYDRSKFIIYCYYNYHIEDGISIKYRSYPEINWFNISSKTTENVCELIKSHEIDVLIDLSGHTNHNRMDVMARKPAPVQFTYLGFPNSTGLTTVDYRITDKYADPVDTKQFYSEKLVRMPRCFLCFEPMIDPLLVPINHVKKDQIVFGVFNKFHKYNDDTYKVWNNIIMSIPNSLLIIKKCVKNEEANKCFSKLNLPKEKYIILDQVSNQVTFYNNFNFIDICLDTFPYSGTTTSCDTLFMSTPIVTLNIPNRHVSNVTSSILFNMGMPELVAHSLDEYADIAINLAKSPERVAYYKQNIRQKFMEVMDSDKFVKEFDYLILTTYLNHNKLV